MTVRVIVGSVVALLAVAGAVAALVAVGVEADRAGMLDAE